MIDQTFRISLLMVLISCSYQTVNNPNYPPSNYQNPAYRNPRDYSYGRVNSYNYGYDTRVQSPYYRVMDIQYNRNLPTYGHSANTNNYWGYGSHPDYVRYDKGKSNYSDEFATSRYNQPFNQGQNQIYSQQYNQPLAEPHHHHHQHSGIQPYNTPFNSVQPYNPLLNGIQPISYNSPFSFPYNQQNQQYGSYGFGYNRPYQQAQYPAQPPYQQTVGLNNFRRQYVSEASTPQTPREGLPKFLGRGTVEIINGRDAQLTCLFNSPDSKVVSNTAWVKVMGPYDHHGLVPSFECNSPARKLLHLSNSDLRYKVISSENFSTLKIFGVQSQDYGVYRCASTAVDGKGKAETLYQIIDFVHS